MDVYINAYCTLTVSLYFVHNVGPSTAIAEALQKFNAIRCLNESVCESLTQFKT